MIEIRPAFEQDFVAEHEVFATAEGALWAQHNFDWAVPPFEAWAAVHRHLLDQDGDRFFVATDGEAIVGFTAALARRDTWFFSDLFILPEYQGQGIGRELLERAWEGSFARRLTITDSFQPHSNTLYARRGLLPATPILHLGGRPTAEPPDGLVPYDPNPTVLAALDLIAYGFDRAPDHHFWHEQKGPPIVWLLRREPVGYAYSAPSGLIGPLAACDEVAAGLILRAELARRTGEETMLFVPGTSRSLVSTALDGGLRFIRPPGLLLLSEGCPAPSTLAISGYWLL